MRGGQSRTITAASSLMIIYGYIRYKHRAKPVPIWSRSTGWRAGCSNTNFLCSLTWNSSNTQMSHVVSDNTSGPVDSYLSSQGYFTITTHKQLFLPPPPPPSSLNDWTLLLPLSKQPFSSRQWRTSLAQTQMRQWKMKSASVFQAMSTDFIILSHQGISLLITAVDTLL